MSVQEQIRHYLAERFLFEPEAKIDPSQSLLRAGILDSTGVMEVVMFLEETFGIQVRDDELVAANFDTIAGMTRFVETRVADKSAA